MKSPTLKSVLLVLVALQIASSLKLSVNSTRVLEELEQLATHNDLSSPSVQRIIYTPSDLSARAYILSLFTSANLQVRVDAVGNQFGIWRGQQRSSPIATGSHIDAIPHSGRFDGTLGVVGAIEAVRALQAANFHPARDVHVVAFTSEEPTRFGIGCLGSRLLSGALLPAHAARLTDEAGVTIDEARNEAGFTGDLADVELSKDAYGAFVELHIEQGPLLEQRGIDIGAVTAIAAPAQLNMRFSGPGGHAGAVLMNDRHDAALAAAEAALEAEAAAKEAGSEFSVATTGKWAVFPGAANSVPSVAEVSVDVRDIELHRRDAMVERIREAAKEVAMRRGVEWELNVTNADAPALCARKIVEAVRKAAVEGGMSMTDMVSRAYHDALFMARKWPTGMIFVPCREGVSHRPDEFVEEKDVRNGVETLARTIAILAGDGDDPNALKGYDEVRDEL